MIEGALWAYGAAFAASLAATVVLTPLALEFAQRRRLLDLPGGHKTHVSPVPYLGGIAIVLGFSLAIFAAAALAPVRRVSDLALILGLGVALALVGLVDDLRGASPIVRLVAEGLAGTTVWLSGSGVSLFEAEPLNLVLTVLWIVGITNALNLLDNMDGLSAGVAAISAGFFFLLASINGQFLVGALSAALAGCALGFLKHNVHPAKIYMGDAGSLFLGFLLAVIGLRLRFDGPTQATFLVPILVMAVPIFDTTLVTVARIVNGRNPVQGGRDHASHRLVFIGLPVRVAVGTIYGAAIAAGWIAVVVSRIDIRSAWLLAGLVGLVAGTVGTLLGLVPVYEDSKRRHLMIQEVIRHEPGAEA